MTLLTDIINRLVIWLAANEHRHWLLIVPMAIGIGLADGPWRVAAGMFAFLVGMFIGMALFAASSRRNLEKLVREGKLMLREDA